MVLLERSWLGERATRSEKGIRRPGSFFPCYHLRFTYKLIPPSSLASDLLPPSRITLLAAYAGSTVTRTASRITFGRMKRAMQTGDMLNDVGIAFEEVFGDKDWAERKVKSQL